MPKIRDDIREYLEKRGGRESVSALVDFLRQPMPGGRCYGPYPKFPAGHSKAIDEFKLLGFKVEEVYSKNPKTKGMRSAPIRWDVTL